MFNRQTSKMKLLLVTLIALLTLQGCASGCTSHCLLGFGPGNPAFESVANFHDNRDPCQHKGKAVGYQLPVYCGSSQGKVVRVDKATPNTYIVNRY
jgi:hypothetical protein